MADNDTKGPLAQKMDAVKENTEKKKGAGFGFGILAGAGLTLVMITLASKWLRSHQKIVMVSPEGVQTESLNETSLEGFEGLESAL